MRHNSSRHPVVVGWWRWLGVALAAGALVAGIVPGADAQTAAPQGAAAAALARPDPYVARPRIVVMTDIANEPDDQMSMVRFLLYANQFDIEGLVASTSTWMKAKVRPDVILSVLDAYDGVQPNLLKHAPGYPTADTLRSLVASGQPGYGMAAVGPDKASAGSTLILKAAERDDPRPLWVLAWGGTNTLAQALTTARATRTPEQVAALVAKLRVYAISDQDDAGPWLRREFPALRYVASPSGQNGEEYYLATWTGISGDTYYRNAPGADFTTFTDSWVNTSIRAVGPLGKLYPYPCCIHEGDTPSFLGLIDNGLASAMSPAFGGWGGRYIWRQPSGQTRPLWTQGGDSYPGNDSSRDTVVGADGQFYTSDQATIWRWRTAFQNDFAARMRWTIAEPAQTNHAPRVVVNGETGAAPLVVQAQVGTPVTLDATGSTDPDDGQTLRYAWFYYPEAGTGIPGQPVVLRQRRPPATPPPGAGDVPSAPAGGPRQPTARVVVAHAETPRAVVTPQVAGLAHVILAVEDSGAPPLTSYRRVIFEIGPAPEGSPAQPTSTTAAPAPAPARAAAPHARWVGTWASSQQITEPGNLPPAPGFADTTVRQLLRVSIGGSRVRVRFSNAFGRTPLTLLGAHVARSAGGGAIQPGSDVALTFSGQSHVTIREGAMVLSDPIDFALAPLADVAVSVHLRGAPESVTGHPGSRTTSYFMAGDALAAVELPSAVRVDHWYFLSGIDVEAGDDAAAVVVVGDSITDGRGSTTNGNDRWTDQLSRRLRAHAPTSRVAVLNHGLGGNRLLRDGLGPNVLARLERDVLAQPGVRWLILFEGINDIGTASGARDKGESFATADDIIAAYEQIIARAHAHGIRVYGATLMPFEGFTYGNYHTPASEADRQRVNAWIRTSGRFDAVIDFDSATRDPQHPTRLRPDVDGGDRLHPSASGYRIMAEAVDLGLFGRRD